MDDLSHLNRINQILVLPKSLGAGALVNHLTSRRRFVLLEKLVGVLEIKSPGMNILTR